MEGVMMRGRKRMAIAVRAPNGEIVMHEEPLTAAIYTGKWGQWPFVRGLGMLWDALGLGIAHSDLVRRCVATQEGPGTGQVLRPGGLDDGGAFRWRWRSASSSCSRRPWPPSFWSRCGANALAVSLVEGTIRLTLFLVYLWAIGFMPDIRRVFRLSWRRTQDDQRLRGRRPAHPDERGARSARHTHVAAPASCSR